MPDGPDIVDVSERYDSWQVHAGDCWSDRLRAGGEHELGELELRAVSKSDNARVRVDCGGAAAVAQRDAAVAPPALRLPFDIGGGNLTGEHRRQQHAAIGKSRLRADDR